jgi:hypothetical protein
MAQERVEPGTIQGALNAVIERGLREYRIYSPEVVAWALSRDLVEHLTRCRYELVVTTTELTKGDTGG